MKKEYGQLEWKQDRNHNKQYVSDKGQINGTYLGQGEQKQKRGIMITQNKYPLFTISVVLWEGNVCERVFCHVRDINCIPG